MFEKVVRDSFHRNVLSQAHVDHNTLILDEFSLKNGISRADIAVLNGKMIGYEIKTDRDSLQRLKTQVAAYNEVFDNAYIIVGKKHLNKAKELVPDWWGIFLIATDENGQIWFKKLRKTKQNFNKNNLGLLQLLWKEEILKILIEYAGVNLPSRKTKKELYRLVDDKLPTEKLSEIALKCLKSREGWRKGRKELSENVDCFQPISTL